MEYPKNYWYPILEAKKLKRKPLKLKRLDTDFVLWRKKNGDIACLKDRCPHRATSLALGEIVNDNIQCPMHGFQYDASGACKHIPANGIGSPIPTNFCAESFQIREAHELLWLWWGEKQERLPEVPWPDGLNTCYPHYSIDSMENCPVNFYRMMEANLDVLHFPFTHGPSKPVRLLIKLFPQIFGFLNLGPKIDPYFCQVSEDNTIEVTWGFYHEDPKQKKFNPKLPASLSVLFPNQLEVDVAMWKARGHFACCPIDDTRAWFCARYYQGFCRVPLLGDFLAWLYMRWVMGPITNQDLRLQKTQTPQGLGLGHDRPVARADRGIVEYNRLVQRILDEQRKTEIPNAVKPELARVIETTSEF